MLFLDTGGTIAQVWNERTATLKYLEEGAAFGYLDDNQRAVLSLVANLGEAIMAVVVEPFVPYLRILDKYEWKQSHWMSGTI